MSEAPGASAKRHGGVLCGAVLLLAQGSPTGAQTPTPNPGAWRPLPYADLQRTTPATATYANIWRDAIGNTIEAHFVIWSPKNPSFRATVKSCPLRIAIYEGVQVSRPDGGRACFLELAAPAAGEPIDPNRAVAYAAYDVGSKTSQDWACHRPSSD
ncbi:hypothetical protein [Bradyrhizobium sp. CCGUVB23]|uniref:hypothetical protein n=1 Tax=Bradyrhizobium sp. CCGUVB23 TaxID=2949630 RepID=UPI0020B35E3B|nr:hypothetical protein [Bradyrhizobium sp. CCGUVB23]MCP3468565.1 hypothetical protein [Bradyrhizobium sp. CCGUVB23]